MLILNLIKSSLLSLKAHRLRVFLTMIGIIIGISSVVIILSLGEGLKFQLIQSTTDINLNKLSIYFEAEDKNMPTELLNFFNKQDCLELQKINGVKTAQPDNSVLGKELIPINASYFDDTVSLNISKYNGEKLDIEYGRSFNDNDCLRNCIVLNSDTANKLFNSPNEAIGHGINLNGIMCEVIGVLKSNDDQILNFNSNIVQEYSIKEISSDTPFNTISVYINGDQDKNRIFNEIRKQLNILHPGIKGEYKIQDSQAVTKNFEKTIDYLTIFVAFVTGISLLVGGIGVMNITYVSVSERRREIGIRRAIGAKPCNILFQFLFEAIVITGIGGILGILNGYLFAKVIGIFLPFKSILTVKIFIEATCISVITGILFGSIPAYRASKLNPIKAIYK
ncbi:ABC transporter permease [Clostridium sp. HBUAS56017]|uniref:ABC transporter permease n=1 Tax=Clostridium sp. HBUAS56017 TaxID=2571128 RepID=UPI00117820C2|nr:ABC transporter permease [Clostridium sp. HBUAS56017]